MNEFVNTVADFINLQLLGPQLSLVQGSDRFYGLGPNVERFVLGV